MNANTNQNMNANEPMDVDEIERRLSAMTPADPGAGLRERIGASLASDQQRGGSAERAAAVSGRRVVTWLAVAAAFAIAGLVVVFKQVPIGVDSAPADVNTPVAEDAPTPATPGDSDTPIDAVAELPPNPSALQLRIAIARSPEALDELLDAAVPTPRPGRSVTTAPDFSFADRRRLTSMESLRWPDAQKP